MDGKNKILDAARTVIIRSGVNGATVRAIAIEANMTTGAIYHHYKNKEDLLYDLMNESLSVSSQIAKEMTGDSYSKERIKIEIARNTVERFHKDAENRLQYHFAHEVLLGNMEAQLKLKDKYTEWTKQIEQILIHLYGLENTRLNNAFSSWLIAAVDGVVLQYLLDVNENSIDEMMEVFDLLLEKGLPSFVERLNEQDK
ncbi:TetR/AcrR family transcriptional regulator [Exiguobacterium sp. N5]|uniref:TetR/AcrR family transcriptional regulator n=1 Tax=Exiguobacterium sp. N5 TaxID=2990450 RepID=UPI0021F449FE|nr:TetR/AcrR family transcriptional regulator [Exiguobacterium sp. N5]MCV9899387.1 TetR/AcrR family transcriptional regulator [Exiguobacterium sp. N5]